MRGFPFYVDANLSALVGAVSLTVTVDDGDNSVDAEVEITVVAGANMPPVFFSTPYTFNVASNAIVGAVVGTVSATDAEGDGLTYTLSGAGAANFIVKDGTAVASGEEVSVVVAANADLPSLGNAVTIMITAADDATPASTATVTLEIAIIAGNVAPVFDQTAYTFDLAEGAATRTVMGRVSATDSNAGDLLTYMLSGTGPAILR